MKKKLATQVDVLAILAKPGYRLRIATHGKLPPFLHHRMKTVGRYQQVQERVLLALRNHKRIKLTTTVHEGDHDYHEYAITPKGKKYAQRAAEKEKAKANGNGKEEGSTG